MSKRAGLTFPVGRIGSRLRKGNYARRVGAGAPVYLAAVLEFVTAELLELASGAIGKDGKRIKPRTLARAVREDNELGSLFQNVTLSQGGVVGQVHEALQKKTKKSKKSSKKAAKH